MPTTRAQAAAGRNRTSRKTGVKREKPATSRKEVEKRPAKRAKVQKSESGPTGDFSKEHGTLERGHIYFFYRPKVSLEESHDIDDVAKFQLLLVPRPDTKGNTSPEASAAPAAEPQNKHQKNFRHISVGKKRLPDPKAKHEVFWASVLNAGNDLDSLEQGLDEKVYQTKTRGERHVQPARLAGRGAYAIYSSTDTSLPPSKRDQTYLAYHLSHPSPPGDVQTELGIHPSSSFVLQVKNPNASAPPQAGLPRDKRADYPAEAQHTAFGEGAAAKRFVPANPPSLLDFVGAELLLIADKTDIGAVIGEERTRDLEGAAEGDAERLSTEQVMHELLLDSEKFPADAIEGKWV